MRGDVEEGRNAREVVRPTAVTPKSMSSAIISVTAACVVCW